MDIKCTLCKSEIKSSSVISCPHCSALICESCAQSNAMLCPHCFTAVTPNS